MTTMTLYRSVLVRGKFRRQEEYNHCERNVIHVVEATLGRFLQHDATITLPGTFKNNNTRGPFCSGFHGIVSGPLKASSQAPTPTSGGMFPLSTFESTIVKYQRRMQLLDGEILESFSPNPCQDEVVVLLASLLGPEELWVLPYGMVLHDVRLDLTKPRHRTPTKRLSTTCCPSLRHSKTTLSNISASVTKTQVLSATTGDVAPEYRISSQPSITAVATLLLMCISSWNHRPLEAMMIIIRWNIFNTWDRWDRLRMIESLALVIARTRMVMANTERLAEPTNPLFPIW